jgi:hypothetical protein
MTVEKTRRHEIVALKFRHLRTRSPEFVPVMFEHLGRWSELLLPMSDTKFSAFFLWCDRRKQGTEFTGGSICNNARQDFWPKDFDPWAHR